MVLYSSYRRKNISKVHPQPQSCYLSWGPNWPHGDQRRRPRRGYISRPLVHCSPRKQEEGQWEHPVYNSSPFQPLFPLHWSALSAKKEPQTLNVQYEPTGMCKVKIINGHPLLSSNSAFKIKTENGARRLNNNTTHLEVRFRRYHFNFIIWWWF